VAKEYLRLMKGEKSIIKSMLFSKLTLRLKLIGEKMFQINQKTKLNFLYCLLLVLLTICFSVTDLISKNINYVSNREPLIENPYIVLPIGSITPKGWLEKQLKLAADGMTGHLDEIWKDVNSDNGWLGGSGDAWERGPYWLDGLVPLAYILKNKALIKKAKKWIDYSLKHQQADGYFGPVPDTNRVFEDSKWGRRQKWQEKAKQDWWPHMVMLKVMQSYYEATQDKRVLDFMTRYFQFQLKHIKEKPLNHWTHWAKSRGGENLASIYWLYNYTGDTFLIELGKIIFEQTLDWTERFESADAQAWRWHGVNTGMGVKQPGVWYQYSKKCRYLKAVKTGVDKLMKNHGQVYGLWAADELLAGTDPTKGTESCTVVEYMFSLETMLQISGDPEYGDWLERVALNAQPALLKADHTARQYYQLANQVVCDRSWHNFSTKHGETENLFGLETGFGCCTANYHQGWPKYVNNTWYATQDNGLAALVYAPSEVTAKVGDNVQVTFVEETGYPFKDKIKFTYKKGVETTFPFHFRIPAWCEKAVVSINGTLYSEPQAGSITKVVRRWKKGDVLELFLPMKIKISYWHERSSAVERGPLVYALGLKEEWKKIAGDEPFADYELFSKDPWNYGLLRNYIDYPDTTFIVTEFDVTDLPWTLENAPIKIIAQAKKIPAWQIYGGVTGPIPYSPYWHPIKYDTDVEKIILVPYGCTKLRVAVFPVVR